MQKDKQQCDCEKECSCDDSLPELQIPDTSCKSLIDYKIIQLVGEINEENSNDVICALTLVSARALEVKSAIKSQLMPDDPKNDTAEDSIDETFRPEINFMISTYGGAASESFSIYDIMNIVKRDCTIKTIGYGKVMSAGVLLLAAGTKGERYVTKNCRLMLHSISAGTEGKLAELEKEMSEIKHLQESYIECLAAETKLSKVKLKKMFEQNSNVYLSAEEAIKYGIADRVA